MLAVSWSIHECPWVAQYMLNDVLHNPRAYTKRYSIVHAPCVYWKMVAYQNVTSIAIVMLLLQQTENSVPFHRSGSKNDNLYISTSVNPDCFWGFFLMN